MNQHCYELLQIKINFNWTAIISIFAILVSICSLLLNRAIARKNTLLSIQQAIFKTVAEKAKDCNSLWDNEPESEQNNNSPHYTVVSEVVISKEVIDKSFYLFGKNSGSIKNFVDDYYFLLWKQLRTDLRGFIQKAPDLSIFKENKTFAKQISDLHIVFEQHFEK